MESKRSPESNGFWSDKLLGSSYIRSPDPRPRKLQKEESELVSGIADQTHYDSVTANQVDARDPGAGALLLKGPDGNLMSISVLQFPH